MIIYDLEIQKLIPSPKVNNLSGFDYCEGWTDFFNMNFACGVIFDTARNEYRIFDEFMLDDLKAVFKRTDMIVGFNIFKFDNNVLKSYDFEIPETKCYDLLFEIAKAAGTPNDYKGLGLGAVCEANFKTGKTGSGANAPILYQQKRFGELFDYCLADVRLTKKLLDRVMDFGHIINPRNGQWIRVNRPR